MPEETNGCRSLRVLRQTLRDVWDANVMEWGAAIAFHLVLSLFPLVLAGAAVASLIVDPVIVADLLGQLVEGIIPPEAVNMEPIVSRAIAERRQVGFLAVLLWLVSGRRLLGMLVTALDRVSDVDQRQESLPRRAAVELVLLALIALLFLAALAGHWVFDLIWEQFRGEGLSGVIGWFAGAVVHTALLMAAFTTLYAVVPRGDRRWPAVLVGAVCATGMYLAARGLFLAFSGVVWDSFNLMYGPITVAAVLLTWAWVIGLVVLFGASLAWHVKVMILEGGDPQEAERRHVAHKTA